MKDLSGNRYGKLLAVKPNGEKNRRKSYIWECDCDCGNKKFIAAEHLTTGSVKSCGCLKPGNPAADLTGKKYGRLTVISRAEKPEEGLTGIYVYFLCRCDCGKEIITRATALKGGLTKSCGCLSKESVSNKQWRGFEGISITYFNKVKTGAKHRGIDFNITIEELWEIFQNQNGECAISGVGLKLLGKGSGLQDFMKRQTASLDRIDSAKGYTKENTQWIHKTVNRMKGCLSDQEFLDWVAVISVNKKDRLRYNVPLAEFYFTKNRSKKQDFDI